MRASNYPINMISLSPSTTLLFIGDSITDCGRRSEPEEIGNGYVRIVRDYLCARDPTIAPRVVNRGISGNKIGDLQKRWQRDVLDLRPDLISIYIGINDVWHGLEPRCEGTDIAAFIAGYREILARTRRALPSAKIVLCEPSVLWLSDPPNANDRLMPYVTAVHQLAAEFAAECVVELHAAFVRARELRSDIAWTVDGVHPTSIGHMLIARAWLDAAGLP